MKISSVANFQVKNNESAFVKQNKFLQMPKNNFSFTGDIFLKGSVSDVNEIEFPDDLYLSLDDTFEKLENEDRTYRRWENFRFDLTKLFAKRCNYLGLSIGAKSGSIGSDKDGTYITIYDAGKKENQRITEFDWSHEYQELKEFFDGSAEFPFGASDDMETIKEELPEILRKQGWIK